MSSIPDGSFDIVVSIAVLEHIANLDAAAREPRRVSKPGAIHYHQVDFRDHRNFDRPLEHLLMLRREFQEEARAANFEFGCQWRASEVIAVFKAAGFQVVDTEISDTVDPAYFADFRRRLRWRFFSPYKWWRTEDLRILGARIWLTVPHPSGTQSVPSHA